MLVHDDASAYLDNLPPEKRHDRLPRTNGPPKIRPDNMSMDEAERARDTCLDALKRL